MQKQSLRPRRAAEYLGISLATLWRWVHRPGFPQPRQLSARCTVFDADELRQWRDAQQREAA